MMERISNPKAIEALRGASAADRATRDAMSRGFTHRMDRLAAEHADVIRRYEAGPTGDLHQDLETARRAVAVQAEAIAEGATEFRRRQDHLRNIDDAVRGLVPEIPRTPFPVGTAESFVQALRVERSNVATHWFAAGSFLAVPLEPSDPESWFRHAGRTTYRPGLKSQLVREAIVLRPEWWAVLQTGEPELLDRPVRDLARETVDTAAKANSAVGEEVSR